MMFVRLVDKNSREGTAININSITYIAERKEGTEEQRFYLYIETEKGAYRIYFENEKARQEAFEVLLRKKGILNLNGVNQTYFRENIK